MISHFLLNIFFSFVILSVYGGDFSALSIPHQIHVSLGSQFSNTSSTNNNYYSAEQALSNRSADPNVVARQLEGANPAKHDPSVARAVASVWGYFERGMEGFSDAVESGFNKLRRVRPHHHTPSAARAGIIQFEHDSQAIHSLCKAGNFEQAYVIVQSWSQRAQADYHHVNKIYHHYFDVRYNEHGILRNCAQDPCITSKSLNNCPIPQCINETLQQRLEQALAIEKSAGITNPSAETRAITYQLIDKPLSEQIARLTHILSQDKNPLLYQQWMDERGIARFISYDAPCMAGIHFSDVIHTQAYEPERLMLNELIVSMGKSPASHSFGRVALGYLVHACSDSAHRGSYGDFVRKMQGIFNEQMNHAMPADRLGMLNAKLYAQFYALAYERLQQGNESSTHISFLLKDAAVQELLARGLDPNLAQHSYGVSLDHMMHAGLIDILNHTASSDKNAFDHVRADYIAKVLELGGEIAVQDHSSPLARRITHQLIAMGYEVGDISKSFTAGSRDELFHFADMCLHRPATVAASMTLGYAFSRLLENSPRLKIAVMGAQILYNGAEIFFAKDKHNLAYRAGGMATNIGIAAAFNRAVAKSAIYLRSGFSKMGSWFKFTPRIKLAIAGGNTPLLLPKDAINQLSNSASSASLTDKISPPSGWSLGKYFTKSDKLYIQTSAKTVLNTDKVVQSLAKVAAKVEHNNPDLGAASLSFLKDIKHTCHIKFSDDRVDALTGNIEHRLNGFHHDPNGAYQAAGIIELKKIASLEGGAYRAEVYIFGQLCDVKTLFPDLLTAKEIFDIKVRALDQIFLAKTTSQGLKIFNGIDPISKIKIEYIINCSTNVVLGSYPI